MVTPQQKQEALDALEAFKAFLRTHLAARRGCPHAGMMGRVLAAEHDGVLDEEETLTNLVSMLIAGHETTVTLIGNGLLLLLQNPGEMARLRADRTLMHLALRPTIAVPKWESRGGDLRCTPTVVSWGPNRLDVLAIDADGNLLHLPFGNSWGIWAKIGGQRLSSRPAAVSTTPGRIDVVALNFEQQRVHIVHRQPSGWSTWEVGGIVG